MGRAGAEKALLELLKRIDKTRYEVSLYVLTGQGELINDAPPGVRLLNKRPVAVSVHSGEGRRILAGTCVKSLFKRLNIIRLLPYFVKNTIKMLRSGSVMPDKLLWRAVSDGVEIPGMRYDLAVALIEGAAAYFVADHVQAVKKAAFIHVDYRKAGYTRLLDKDCYLKFDKVFGVSGEVVDVFKGIYPELCDRVEIFHNLIDAEAIKKKAAPSPINFSPANSGNRYFLNSSVL